MILIGLKLLYEFKNGYVKPLIVTSDIYIICLID